MKKREPGERIEALIEAQQLGRKIEDFTNDPDIAGFFNALRSELIEDMVSCDIADDEGRRACAATIQAFDRILGAFRGASNRARDAEKKHEKIIEREGV